MNFSHRLISHENCQSLVSLPGSWPGRINGSVRILKEDEKTQSSWGVNEHGFIYPEYSVLLFSGNNYVTNGIRFSLEDISGIRLRVSSDYEDILSQANEFSPDVIIFTPSSANDSCRVMKAIVSLCSVKSLASVIVLGSSSGILCQLSSAWKNFHFISDIASPHALRANVLSVLEDKKSYLPSIESLLTPQQWRTLTLLAKGFSISCVANMLCVSTKTISLHKTTAMRRLGINEKLHEAWLLNAISKLS